MKSPFYLDVNSVMRHGQPFFHVYLNEKMGSRQDRLLNWMRLKIAETFGKRGEVISSQDILNVLTREGSQLLGRAALENICCVKLC